MRGAPFSWRVRVYYEDTDATGLVYHAEYLRYMERARTEWLRAMGFDQHELRTSEGVIFVVAAAQLTYLKPAQLDDLLDVEVKLARHAPASLLLTQSVSAHGEDLCSAEIRIACVDAHSKRPKRIPAAIRAELINAS